MSALVGPVADLVGGLGLAAPRQVVFDGAVAGLTYGLLAVGLILVYRSSRVVNFAYGEMGAFGAALLARLVVNWHWSYGAALVAVLAVGAALGALVELVVVRRLFDAPRVVLFVAMLGVAQLIFVAQLALPSLTRVERFPTPLQAHPTVAGVVVRSDALFVLLVAPVVAVATAWFLARTRQGTAVRAAAANPDAARLSAISVERTSTLVWVLAGALATVTAVLLAPLRTTTAVATEALGPTLLLDALAAALIGRMRSMPLALLGGVGIGVTESLLYLNHGDQPGLIDGVLFVVVLVAVLTVARSDRHEEPTGTWSLAAPSRPTADELPDGPWGRVLPRLGAATALGAAVLLPVVFHTASRQFLFSRMLLLAMVALSVTILTGWAGQLSLGQFGFVGLGAMSTAALVRAGWSFELAVPAATVVTILAALVVGTPTLRVRGLFLAVTTLAFAVMVESWLLHRPLLVGDRASTTLPRAHWGHTLSLGPERTYYYVCLAALVLALLVATRLRRSGVGRSLLAVRDNERAAAAFAISPTRAKLTAFGVGGGLAGLAGGLLAGLFVSVRPEQFSVDESLRVVAIAVIGGLTSVSGAVLGALWVVGLPALLGDSREVSLLTSGAGLLVLLLYLPGGLVRLGERAHDALRALALFRGSRGEPAGVTTASEGPQIPPPVASAPPRSTARRASARPPGPDGAAPGAPSLRVDDVSVRFGGRTVVEHATLEVHAGEIVGLIGTNGAGKSTLLEAIGGTVPATGRIELLGRDVSRRGPTARARLGLARSFQRADLFPALTVRETVMTAFEARARTPLTGTLLGLPAARRAERGKAAEADALVAFLGLGRDADRRVGELSTGTRRIVQLAALVALDGRVLCLDEPTAGLAQRETEAFGPLLVRLREELGASMLVVEHDMPLVMSITDRVYCLEAGRVIAHGTPGEIRHDARVIASYLGTDRPVDPTPRLDGA